VYRIEYISTSCATCRQIWTYHSCTHQTALAASQTACFIIQTLNRL